MIQLGEADVVLTGGMESMSQAPHVIRGLRSGLRLGQGAARGHAVVGAARHALRLHDGRRPPRTARRSTASRARSRTRYAIRSQQLADAAWKEGRLDEEVVPVEIKIAQGRRALRAGRSHAAGLDAGGAGEAAGGVQQERLRHGRQRAAASSTAAPRCCSRRRRASSDHGLTPLARLTHWAYRRRRADADGHGAGAGDADGAREGRA